MYQTHLLYRHFSMNKYKNYIYSLVLLACVDIVLTLMIINNGGLEGNPFMVPLIKTWWGNSLKVIITLSLGLYLSNKPKKTKYDVSPKLSLIIVNSIMGLVCLYNLFNLSIILIYQPYK